jgi:hypothetical protein
MAETRRRFDPEFPAGAVRIVQETKKPIASLDAIHLATARVLGADLEGLATYDDRLAIAGKDAGIAVVDPRDGAVS